MFPEDARFLKERQRVGSVRLKKFKSLSAIGKFENNHDAVILRFFRISGDPFSHLQ
jgi:hypothetical protein